MRHKQNPNRAKIHRNYTVEEIADLFEVHRNTVRSWIKSGLPVCDDRKPMLVLGNDLREFLQQRRVQRKRKCLPWEFYCLRCRNPQPPAGNMADFDATTADTGRLIALCSRCECVMNKFVNHTQLGEISAKIDVSVPSNLEHIIKRDCLLLNCALK